MGKNRENLLLEHFQNPTFRDEPCRLVLPGRCDRLSTLYHCGPGGWYGVTRIISDSVRFRTAWFPDANVAIRDDAAPVWDALRLAGLGFNGGSALFTGVVCHELREWFDEPRHHHERADAIRTGLMDATWLRKFRLRDYSSILPAVLGYVRLLGLRRGLARPLQTV